MVWYVYLLLYYCYGKISSPKAMYKTTSLFWLIVQRESPQWLGRQSMAAGAESLVVPFSCTHRKQREQTGSGVGWGYKPSKATPSDILL